MWTRQTITLACASLVVGLAVGAAVGWYVTGEYLGRMWTGIVYQSAASEGGLHARVLQELRQGETEKAINIFETLLDVNLMTLGSLEDDISEEAKNEDIYTAISTMREYRERYPREAVLPTAQETIEKALSIRRPAQQNAP